MQKAICMKNAKRLEHGGSLILNKRKARRPLVVTRSHHLVLKSDFAKGDRSLLKFKKLIKRLIKKSARRFNIKIFGMAIVGNHIHLQVFGQRKVDLQNFFRMAAGQIAQNILNKNPLNQLEILKRERDSKIKNRLKENKFWQSRVYSRVVSWGFDFINVWAYIIRNRLEAAKIIPYRVRKIYIDDFLKDREST